jgi:hypothetical protein
MVSLAAKSPRQKAFDAQMMKRGVRCLYGVAVGILLFVLTELSSSPPPSTEYGISSPNVRTNQQLYKYQDGKTVIAKTSPSAGVPGSTTTTSLSQQQQQSLYALQDKLLNVPEHPMIGDASTDAPTDGSTLESTDESTDGSSDAATETTTTAEKIAAPPVAGAAVIAQEENDPEYMHVQPETATTGKAADDAAATDQPTGDDEADDAATNQPTEDDQ